MPEKNIAQEIKRRAKVSSGLSKEQGYINGSYLAALAPLHSFTWEMVIFFFFSSVEKIIEVLMAKQRHRIA